MVKLNSWGALAAGILCLAAASGSGPSACAASAEDEQPLVTVELFTSQGCSSCLPADAYLAELAKRPDVLALSLPVDYWDYLGWRDTLAIPEHTKRQYDYAQKLGTRRPYTPQVVVDGHYDCVGSDKQKIEFAIKRFEKANQTRIPVSVAQEGTMVTVSVGARPETRKKKPADVTQATVWLVRFEPTHQVPIAKGENEGHTVTYTNVVRNWSPLGVWDGTPASFKLSRTDLNREGVAFAVLVQQESTGPILGVARFSLGTE